MTGCAIIVPGTEHTDDLYEDLDPAHASLSFGWVFGNAGAAIKARMVLVK